MTVKTRITLLIVGTGLVASLLFSVVIFFELIEQPFDILDTLLKEEAERTTRMFVQNKREAASDNFIVDKMYPYWIKIYEQGSDKVLYQSDVAKSVPLPCLEVGRGAIVKAQMAPGQEKGNRKDMKKVRFRVRTFSFAVNGKTYATQIGRPLGKLEEELWDMVFGIIAGLVFATLILIAISRLVAGRILRPIGEMKDLAQTISEKNLERRLPVETGRDEFSELAGTINTMLDRLQYSFVKQRDFLFDTSHELKTPLASMRLAIEEISSTGGESSLVQDNLLRLKSQVLRVEKLIKDMLNLSALEVMRGMDSRPVDITGLLSGLLTEYKFMADALHVKMDVRLPPGLMVMGDHEKLSRAFSNIIDNALKYNLDGGRMEAIAEQSEAGLVITIGNTGAGIPEDELPRVFDQFYRIEKSRSSQFGGSGLGLTIVKRIVELHGGEIKMESRLEEWTRITVLFPGCVEAKLGLQASHVL